MHQSFLTMAGPQPLSRRWGDSQANVLCFNFCIVPIVRRRCSYFNIPRQIVQCQTWQTAEESCHGFTSWLSVPEVWGYSRELLDKIQSLSCSPGLGRGGSGYKWLVHLFEISGPTKTLVADSNIFGPHLWQNWEPAINWKWVLCPLWRNCKTNWYIIFFYHPLIAGLAVCKQLLPSYIIHTITHLH